MEIETRILSITPLPAAGDETVELRSKDVAYSFVAATLSGPLTSA